MAIEIKRRFTAAVIYTAPDATTILDVVREAISNGADLRWADLHGTDLRGADLSGTNLSGADLSGVYLHGADLHGADLSGTNLSGTNLRGADLHGADLHVADLSGVYLRGADLSGVYLRGADLRGADLSGAIGLEEFRKFQLVGSTSHYIVIDAPGSISVGCERHPAAWWLAHFQAVGRKHRYTDDQIAEYGLFLKLTVAWMKRHKCHKTND